MENYELEKENAHLKDLMDSSIPKLVKSKLR
jgi:hypothetical protein